METNFIVTLDWLDQHRTINGGYTRAQVKSLGFKRYRTNNWRNKAIGLEISLEQKKNFEIHKETYSKKGLKSSKKRQLKNKKKKENADEKIKQLKNENIEQKQTIVELLERIAILENPRMMY